MIRLGQAEDGRLVLGSNEPFPYPVRHVEYYKEQRLFTLVLDCEDEESILMPCEVSAKTDAAVRLSPKIMVIAMADGDKPYGYSVPLIQIGI